MGISKDQNRMEDSDIRGFQPDEIRFALSYRADTFVRKARVEKFM